MRSDMTGVLLRHAVNSKPARLPVDAVQVPKSALMMCSRCSRCPSACNPGCRSLELQSDLICMACHLCYLHTENDAMADGAAVASNPIARQSPPPLNTAAVDAFGGLPAFLEVLSGCPTEQAQRCILSVLLDAAEGSAVAAQPSLSTFVQSEHMNRCAFACLLRVCPDRNHTSFPGGGCILF